MRRGGGRAWLGPRGGRGGGVRGRMGPDAAGEAIRGPGDLVLSAAGSQ